MHVCVFKTLCGLSWVAKLASRYEEDAVTELTLIYPDLSPSSTAGKSVGGYHLLELSMDL